jgi:hypothetical protein
VGTRHFLGVLAGLVHRHRAEMLLRYDQTNRRRFETKTK